jgi:DNA-binding beta-propeller fold protein YncE
MLLPVLKRNREFWLIEIQDGKTGRTSEQVREIPSMTRSKIQTAGGAHHTVLSPDERFLFVQNSFLNLEGMSDGSITVIDLKNDQVVGSINTLKAAGFNPNCIMPLPNHFQ